MAITRKNVDSSAETSSACESRPPLFVAQLPVDSNGRPSITHVLVANRGEIACRIIATCRKLNLKSTAIFVKEDAQSQHVKNADEAISLGSIDQEGGNPFLNVDLLVSTAVAAGADAIHPGYGYLSENADFANAVRQAGLTFIGPSSEAMSTLGDKRTAKEYLRTHEPRVPLIPGFAGSSQDVRELQSAASKIGYPVMLKASAGGGGRGMRIVREASKLQAELSSAQSEAARSFGSGDCILEKYIEAGKHIEIQIVGDSKGNVISLWERECSIQRRHQKVIEESPSPWLTPEKRREMSDVAVRIGRLLNYENAGTVEFVVDARDGSFYFLEVNTRLQVEHPITEEVTGIDIVSLQLFVAAGGNLLSLPVLRSIPQHGHAIECRLCAEDPQRGFFPEHGTVRLWRPASIDSVSSRDTRFETAIETGSNVSIHFDSMIAKIVVWAPTRATAIEKMISVLSNTVCMGLKTNQLFMRNCLEHPGFSDPAYTTSFIPDNLQSLLSDPYYASPANLQQSLALIPCFFLRSVDHFLPSLSIKRAFHQVRTGFRNQHSDPLALQSNVLTFGHGTDHQESLLCRFITDSGKSVGHYRAMIQPLPEIVVDDYNSKSAASKSTARYNAISNLLRTQNFDENLAYEVEIKGCKAAIVTGTTRRPWIQAEMTVSIASKLHHVYLATDSCDTGNSSTTETGNGQRVYCHYPQFGSWTEFKCFNMLSYCESIREVAGGPEAQLKSVTAPMPCKILAVLKKDGDQVKSGETVMVVESMKMEMNISVQIAGKFEGLVRKGDAVNEGTLLFRVN